MSLFDGRFLATRLEDGEEVLRLRGGEGPAAYASSRPHAGIWGKDRLYVLVPCVNSHSVNKRRKVAVTRFPGLEDKSSDAEVLLLGSPALIEVLVTVGPLWCRAIRSRKGSPRSDKQRAAEAHLKAGK